jgi:hypothetical protein
MQPLEIRLGYRRSEEADLEAFLSALEGETGGERTPHFAKSGALDLVSFVEISAIFVVGVSLKPVVQKYFEGLLNADGLKRLGEDHRRQIVEWFDEVESALSNVVSAVHANLHLIHTSFTLPGREEALTLEVPTDQGNLYVVLNHKHLSPTLLKNVPRGIVSAIRFIYEIGFRDETVAFQLYYDEETEDWPYLFAPSKEGFGNHIDRYVDLRDNRVEFISSALDFDRLFRPTVEDEFKFLVAPFPRE